MNHRKQVVGPARISESLVTVAYFRHAGEELPHGIDALRRYNPACHAVGRKPHALMVQGGPIPAHDAPIKVKSSTLQKTVLGQFQSLRQVGKRQINNRQSLIQSVNGPPVCCIWLKPFVSVTNPRRFPPHERALLTQGKTSIDLEQANGGQQQKIIHSIEQACHHLLHVHRVRDCKREPEIVIVVTGIVVAHTRMGRYAGSHGPQVRIGNMGSHQRAVVI